MMIDSSGNLDTKQLMPAVQTLMASVVDIGKTTGLTGKDMIVALLVTAGMTDSIDCKITGRDELMSPDIIACAVKYGREYGAPSQNEK